MKHQMHTNFLLSSSLAVALGFSIWAPVQSQSAEPSAGKMVAEDKMMADVKKKADGKMMEHCHAMMEHKEKMRAEMKKQDAELGELVARMNRAPEEQKLALLGGVVSRMVEQRTAMDAQMTQMGEEMMHHMMQHMEQGNESMLACPMTKGMNGMDKTSAEVPK